MSVSVFDEEPVKPLREPLDLEQADLNPQPLEKHQLVVALKQKQQGVSHYEHCEKV